MTPGPPTPAFAVLQALTSAEQPVFAVSSVPQTGMRPEGSQSRVRDVLPRWKSAGLVEALSVTPASSQRITLLGRYSEPEVKLEPLAPDNSTATGALAPE